jgi:3-hydroxybutyrate dehydrogenase
MVNPISGIAAAQPELSGRVALVTGGASGIGRACVLRLSAAGAHVVIVDLDGAAADELAEQIGGMAYRIDLAEPDGLDGLDLDVDIVVNNAGLQHVAPVEEFPPERFAQMLRVMLESPFRIVRGALPHMYRRGWGRIVNVSSVHGLRASPFKAAYVAAKHGLEGLSKVVALEAAGRGVTSNCVNPGYVRTPLVERQIESQARVHGLPESEVVEQIMLAHSAVKRLAEPAEVAELVAYLCSGHASLITGASFTLDGGWTAQ